MVNIEQLYQMYFKDVYLYLRTITKNQDLAEELTQETFFKALKGIGKFRGECDVRVWLCQIAKNTYFRYCEKNNLLPLYLDGLCSEESKQVVEEHLEHCQECKQAVELMKKEISIEQDNDEEVIKKVKHRIRIEKTVVGVVIALVLCAMMFWGGLSLIANQVSMNDLLHDNDVRIEEDENGDVWLVRSGNAVYASHEIGEQYTEDGKLIIGMGGSEVKDYEGDCVVNMVLLESRMSKISQQILGETASIDEEKSLLFNVKDKPHYCKVQITLKDHVNTLWERDSKEE